MANPGAVQTSSIDTCSCEKRSVFVSEGRRKVSVVQLSFALCLFIVFLSGCGSGIKSFLTASAANPAGALHGSVHGGQQPISGAVIQLYAAGSTGDGSLATALLTTPVHTGNDGSFDISGSYTCPSADTQVYIVAVGGDPGTGFSNSSIALMAALGPCGSLSNSTSVSINEVTTIGSIWPLAPFAKSASQIGSSIAHLSEFDSAVSSISQLVNLASGTAPGLALPAGQVAPVSKIYTLANILAACVNTSGGVAGDGTVCGRLFSYATPSGTPPPTDTISALIAIAQNPTNEVTSIFYLSPSVAVFQPILNTPPVDWTLSLSAAPATPSIAPGAGTLMMGASVSITEATPGAVVHYTLDGTVPTLASSTYSSPIAVNQSVTVQALAVMSGVSSALASASYTVTPSVSVTMTPSSVALSPSQIQTFAAGVSGSQNSAVTWTLSPAIGSLSAAGIYTAPATIAVAQTVTITATSVADAMKSAGSTVALVPPPATTYYVDNVLGNDGNPGTSSAQPFATVAKINSLKLLAGQSVAFRSGEEWHETLVVGQSGTASAPIIYTSFGSGAQPILSAADTLAGSWTQGTGAVPKSVWFHAQSTDPKLINIGGQAGVPVGSIGAIVAANQYFWDGSATLYVYSIVNPSAVVEVPQRPVALTSTGASNITITGLEFRGAQTYDVYCGATLPCANWTFESDTFNASYSNELYWQQQTGVTSPGLIIKDSTFKGGGSSGIKLTNGGASQSQITNNQFFDLCKIYNTAYAENTWCDAVYGFSQTGTDQSGTYVAHNVIHDIGVGQTAQYGGGIHPDTVTGWDIEYNTVQNTNMPGVLLEKGTGSTARYNLIVNSGTGLYLGGLTVRAGDGNSASNHLVELNTVYGGYWSCNIAIEQNGSKVTMTGLTFRKNICAAASSGTQMYADVGANGDGDSYKTNSFGVAGSNFVVFDGVPLSTYASFDAAVGATTESIQGDPQFVNPAGGVFTLMMTSPAIGIGAFPGN